MNRTHFGLRLWRCCALALVFSTTNSFALETNILEASPSQLKKLSLEDLMQLDVTSVSRRPEPYRQAPAAIQVITQEDIRRSGVTSIPEALRLANNLQVAQVDARNWAITARGFNGTTANKLLVLIDGRSVYTPLFSGVFWDVQDYLLEDLERIEVISGPGATLFGANAVNGVINIISKSAKDTQGVLLTGGGGTELRGFGGVRYGGMLASNVSYRVYGKYFNRDDSVFPGGENGHDDWRMGQGGFRLDWDASEQNVLTFQGDIYDGTADQLRNGDLSMSGGNLLSRWSHTFSDESDMSLQFYYDRTHRRIPGTFAENLDTYDVDFDHRFALGNRNQIIWGVGYRFTRNKVQNSPALAFLPPRLDRHLFTAFIQDEIMLRENLFLTLGTKLEQNDYSGFEIQPSVRLSWNVATNHFVWTAVSRAVRTPSRIDRHLFVPPPPSTNFVLAGGDFDSESVIAYELGYRVQPHPKVSASISTFFNDYDDLRSVRTNPPPRVIANDVVGETYGVELDATYQVLDWWRLRAGYTWLKGNLREKDGRNDLNNAGTETADPEHQISLQSLMSLPGNVELDGQFRWVDELNFVSNGQRDHVPSYFSLDLRLGWHPTENLEFSIVGQNLLDSQHPEFGPTRTRHEIERSVYGKVTWRF
ncbi:MAG: TonB-dependent receptor [Verrucomicrobiota bacterium]